MPILKRVNKYQGLKDIDVFREESGLTSQFFQVFEVPDAIPQGKSSFLIAGSPFLKNNVEVKIEILDAGGNVVYTEPVPGLVEGNARRVSIEVYDDVIPGDGVMYIVGELRPNFQEIAAQVENQDNIFGENPSDLIDEIGLEGNDVPPDFQGVYNVRYSRPIYINAGLPNEQPIFFYKQPSISALEIVKPFIENLAPPADVTITGSVSVNPAPDILPVLSPPPPDPPDLGYPTFDEQDLIFVGQQIEKFKNSRKAKINPFQNQSFRSRGRLVRRASPEIDRFTINVNNMESGAENAAGKVSSALVGGSLTINSPQVDTVKYPTSDFTIPSSYTTKIKKVKNDTLLIPEDDFFLTRKDTGERIPVDILDLPDTGGNTNVTMSYSPTPTASLSTTHFRSFVKVTTSGLRTFSGDVFKAKVFAKSQGALGDFEPKWEGPIESPQLLIDPFSDTGFVNVGYFHKQSVIDDNWVSGSTTTTITKDDSQIIDGVEISGSNYTDGSSLTFTTSGSFELENNVPYTIQFDSYFYKELAEDENGNEITDFDCEVQIAKSGKYNNGSLTEYETLGKINIDNFDSNEGEIPGVFTTFVSPSVGDPKLKVRFKVNRGRLIVSDVVARPYSETNFNPDYFECIIPLDYPLPKRPDKYDFLVEFYDVNNNLAETFAIVEGIDIVGPRVVVGDGLDNTFSGSMLIGESMEMYGVNPAYLRSVGYQGFQHSIDNNLGGFMIFSGSVDSRITASEESGYEYNGGVGLEIVDGGGSTDRYLRFRTQPSIFEVVTDTFFLGSTSQFVSGSDGNIEISSSNFHLNADGDVNMSGTITATAGNIGGFDITNDSLSSDNFFLSGSATGNEGKDDTNLFISSSGFAVTAEGDLTGSQVLLTGGKIAGWTIDGTTLVGANATLDGAGSALFRTDAGPGSDSSAVFDQLRDEYYIDFTPTEGATNSAGQFYVKFGPNFSINNDGILFASGAKFEGSITASAGLIGGFTVGSASLFAGTSEAAPRFFISGSATGTDFDKANLFISSSGFQVNSQGGMSASLGDIGGFTIDTDEIRSNTTDASHGFNLRLKNDGEITGSNVLFDGGKVGGFNITSTAISSSRLLISDDGSNNTRIRVYGDSGNTEVIRFGEISDDTSDKHGLKLFNSSGTEIVRLGQQGNKIGGWEITDSQIRSIPDAGLGGLYEEDETGLIINSDGKIETSDFATGLKGWRIDSAGNGTAEFENARIRGTLRTAVFEKESVNVVGGQLMVANSTTIQPLRNSSGSLVVSTGPAASSSYSATAVTMSMANVTGFTSGSIIKAKKVDDTGFSVEYLHVEGNQRFTEAGSPISASLAAQTTAGFMDAVDPDGLAGFVFVSRGYGGVLSPSGSTHLTSITSGTNPFIGSTTETDVIVDDGSVFSVQDIIKVGNGGDDERMKITAINGNILTVIRDFQDTTAQAHAASDPVWRIDTTKEFLAGLVSTAQSYNEGQVFVDTGKYIPDEDISSGYMLMNANPNDVSTPYMDIVERTGSGPYDLVLRSRLGDLSGLSSGYLYGDDEPGFGLYTENAFFKGSVTADTGSIAGILHVATVQGGLETGEKISIGRDVSGTNDGIYVNNNNYWYTTAEFRLGDSSNYFHVSGTVANPASNIDIKTDTFQLDTSNLDINSAAGGSGSIALGATPPTQYNSGNGFFVDGSGKFLLGNTSNNHMKWDGTNLTLVGTIRQTTAGTTITDYVDRGTWSGSSTSYSVNDLVQYDGSTYKCIQAHTSTNDTDSTTGRPDTATNSWAVYAAGGSDGSPGAAGAASKTVSLSASSNVIEYNAAGGGGSGTITLTATSQNFTDAYFKFTGGGGAFSDESSYTDGSGANSDTATFTIPASYSSTPYTFTVSVQEGSSGGEVASDTVTIASIKPGADGDDGVDALTIVNTNPTHTLPANASGVVSSYSNSGTTIQVYEGTTQLDYDGSGGTAGHFTVATSQSPSSTITIGGVSDSTNDAVVANHSSMVDNTDNVVITYTITGKRLDGTSLGTITTTQSIGKNKTGSTGAAGAGVVFRGVYDASKTYFHTSIRKDLVEGSDGNYYIVNNESDNNSSNWDNPVGGSDWTSFGAQFSSVATDILLAQNATITNGLVIGDGAADGFIRSADATTETDGPGFFMIDDHSEGNARFRVGTATSGDNYLHFNGSGLTVKAGTFDLNATSLIMDSSGDSGAGIIRLGPSGGPSSPTDTSNEGIYLDGGGAVNIVGSNSSNILQVDNGTMTMKAGTFDLSTTYLRITDASGVSALSDGITISGDDKQILVGSSVKLKGSEDGGTGTIRLGSSYGPSSGTANVAGIYMDGGGDLNIYRDADNLFRFGSSGLTIKTDNEFILKAGTGPNLIIDSTGASSKGKIAMGVTPPTSATSGTGVYLDGDGTFLAGVHNGNRIQRTSGGAVAIQSNAFSLDAGTIIMDSSANSGTIRLGSGGGPTGSEDTTTEGVYMDGSGEFNLVGGTNAHFRYASTGIDMTGTFTNSGTIKGGTLQTTAGFAKVSDTSGLTPPASDSSYKTLRDTVFTTAEDLGSSSGTNLEVANIFALGSGNNPTYEPTHGTPIKLEVPLRSTTTAGVLYGRVEMQVSQSIDGGSNFTNAGLESYTFTNIPNHASTFETFNQTINPIKDADYIRLKFRSLQSQASSGGSSEPQGDSAFDTDSNCFIKDLKVYSMQSQTDVNETGIMISTGPDDYTLLTAGSSYFSNLVEMGGDLKIEGKPYKPGGGSWFTPSDERLKNITNEFNDGLSIINKIKPLRYEYKDDENKEEHIGIIAQELERVAPYAVTKLKSDEYKLDDMRVVNESNMIYILINSVKELSEKVNELEDEIRLIKTT